MRIKPVKIVLLSAMIKCFSEKLSDTRSLKMVERIRSLFLCQSQVFKLLGRFYYVLMLLCKTRERGKIFARAVLSEARARFFRPS